jgi:hypothetical protein
VSQLECSWEKSRFSWSPGFDHDRRPSRHPLKSTFLSSGARAFQPFPHPDDPKFEEYMAIDMCNIAISKQLHSIYRTPVGLYEVIALFMYKRTSLSSCQYNRFTHNICVLPPRLTGYEPGVALISAFAKIHDLIASLDCPPSNLINLPQFVNFLPQFSSSNLV